MAGKALLLGTVFTDAPVYSPGDSGALAVLSSFAEYPIQADGDFSGQDDADFIDDNQSDLLLCQTANSVSDVDYLVIYRGQCANTDAVLDFNAVNYVRAMMGSTILASSSLNWSSHVGTGSVEHWHGAQALGFTVITGDGTPFEIRGDIDDRAGGTDKYNFGACSIVAIPLDSTGGGQGVANENYDYFKNVDNSGSTDLITALNSGTGGGNQTNRTLRASFPDGVSSASVQHSLTFSVPDSGDYLLLYSCELHLRNDYMRRCIWMYPTLDGAEVGGGPTGKYSDGTTGTSYTPDRNYWNNAMHCEIVSLSEGLHTAEIRCLMSGSNGGGDLDNMIRRPRIIVLRKASWTGMTQAQLTSKHPATAGTSGAAVYDNDVAYNTALSLVMPQNLTGSTQTQIVLGNILIRGGEVSTGDGGSPGGGKARLENATVGGGPWSEDAGALQKIYPPWQQETSYYPTFLNGLNTVGHGATAQTWRLRYNTMQAGWGGVFIGRAVDARLDPNTMPPFHTSSTSGTLTSAGNTGGSTNGDAFMIDSGASFGTLYGSGFRGWLTITSGDGSGQGRAILINDSTEIEIQDDWETVPQNGDGYSIYTGLVPVGDAMGQVNSDRNTNLIGFYTYITGV